MIGPLFLAMIAQTVPVMEELGPPHESLLRAREEFDSILCTRPDRGAREKLLGRRYGKRLVAVQAAIVQRFGEEKAKLSYITVQSCRRFHNNAAFSRGWRITTENFERVLRDYEGQYGLLPATVALEAGTQEQRLRRGRE